MNAQEPADRDRLPWLRRPLFWWPVTLFTLTTALMLVADRVSAWHRPPDADEHAWRRHADRMLDHLLAELEATDDQSERIRAIGEETFTLLSTAHAEHEADADALRAAVSGEIVDRAALETLRRVHLERAEVLSEAVAARFADALEVLTPDQRRLLLARVDEFRADHRDHGGPFGRHRHHGHRGRWHERREPADRSDAGASAANGA